MSVYFFDTSALQYRYVRNTFSQRVRRVTSDKRWKVYIADVTILEMASALANGCRRLGLTLTRFDAMDLAFLKDVAAKQVEVRTVTQADVQRARHLLRFAGVVKRRNLQSADALISVCCLECALEIKKRVIFYTGDWTLYTTLREINAFRAALRLRYLGPGKGGIPPET
jgi:hypothetical protein